MLGFWDSVLGFGVEGLGFGAWVSGFRVGFGALRSWELFRVLARWDTCGTLM